MTCTQAYSLKYMTLPLAKYDVVSFITFLSFLKCIVLQTVQPFTAPYGQEILYDTNNKVSSCFFHNIFVKKYF